MYIYSVISGGYIYSYIYIYTYIYIPNNTQSHTPIYTYPSLGININNITILGYEIRYYVVMTLLGCIYQCCDTVLYRDRYRCVFVDRNKCG